MSNENILEEVVGLTPRISCLEDGTEVLSLMFTSLAKYKPLVLMDKTEKENFEFLDRHLTNRVDFLLGFCKISMVSSKNVHGVIQKTLKQELSKFVSFLNVCKELSKEGKIIDTSLIFEVTEHFGRLTCSVNVNQKTMHTMEIEACTF